jgi:hypothetical protein
MAVAVGEAQAQVATTEPWITTSSSLNRTSFQLVSSDIAASGLPSGSGAASGANGGVALPVLGNPDAERGWGAPFDLSRRDDFRDRSIVLCVVAEADGRLEPSAPATNAAATMVTAAFLQSPDGAVVGDAELQSIDRGRNAGAFCRRSAAMHPVVEARADPIGDLLASVATATP